MKKKYIVFSTVTLVLLVTLVTYFKNTNTYVEDNSNSQTKKTKGISMNLEQNAGAGDYKTVTQSEWPTEGYIFNVELSRCENGSILKWDATQKTVIVSGNLSDKCYIYFDKEKIITFYLDDVLFSVSENMTWIDWIKSNYSNNWRYKNLIFTYDEFVTMGKRTSSYYPMALGSDYCNNKILVNATELGVQNEAVSMARLVTAKTASGWGSSNNTFDIGSDSPYLLSGFNYFPKSSGITYGFNELSTIIDINDKVIDTLKKSNDVWPNTKYNSNSALYEPAIDPRSEDNYYYFVNVYATCLSPETLIDVEEIDEKGKKRRRRKKLKDIKVGDKVICINPFTLELDTDIVVECDGQMNKKHTCYDNWYFSDGTIITTIHRHRFYNVEKNKFMYMEEWNIGEHALNINNEKIEYIKHEHIEEEINHCTLFTEKYNNYFANGLLSGNRKSKNIKQNR